jgi:hypothetical protein
MSTMVLFEEKQVRRAWNEQEQKWYFAIVDVIAVLTESIDSGAYWRKLKERLKKEGNETVTNCHGLKMTAADGKMRLTDVADTDSLNPSDYLKKVRKRDLSLSEVFQEGGDNLSPPWIRV